MMMMEAKVHSDGIVLISALRSAKHEIEKSRMTSGVNAVRSRPAGPRCFIIIISRWPSAPIATIYCAEALEVAGLALLPLYAHQATYLIDRGLGIDH